MSGAIGVPCKMLHEAEGHVVTVELKTGETYRGSLLEAEDNWNMQIGKVTCTHRDGHTTQLEHVFIRGSKLRLIIIPDMLKNAPMFKKVQTLRKQAAGGGKGKGKGKDAAKK